MPLADEISPSTGENRGALAAETQSLVHDGRWALCNDGKGLERDFKFKTFRATWDFMNRIAAECKTEKHHPEWTNVYNRTHIRWTTHSPAGLSSKDTRMARFCDEVGRALGELVEGSDNPKVGDSDTGGNVDGGESSSEKAKSAA